MICMKRSDIGKAWGMKGVKTSSKAFAKKQRMKAILHFSKDIFLFWLLLLDVVMAPPRFFSKYKHMPRVKTLQRIETICKFV